MMQLRLDSHEANKLKRLNSSNTSFFEFLGYTLNMDSGEVIDSLKDSKDIEECRLYILQTLLLHYSRAEPVEIAGKLVKFVDLPGGNAYEKAFLQRAVKPVAEAFGDHPEKLLEIAKHLGGFALSYGDCSVQIPALPRVPLTIIIWGANEFPASASILYDESASNYLPTEDLAVLAELTTERLQLK